MKPKLSLCLLLCLMLLCLPACQEKNSSAPSQPAASQTGEAEPLRVLVDFDYSSGTSMKISEVFSKMTVDSTKVKGFTRILKDKGGPAVKLEYPPLYGEERDTYLTNLRVEIMSGAGPDVFLCTAYPSIYTDFGNISGSVAPSYDVEPVFKFPTKAMQNQVFLPLNQRIENAQFMEFDKLTPMVMEAGRYEGEQYLMPTGYLLPVTCYPKSDFSFDCPKDMTWQEMGEAGPELALASTTYTSSVWCGFLFNPFVDYEKDEPAFTEEELLDLVREMKGRVASVKGQALPEYFLACLGMGFSDLSKEETLVDPEAFDLDEGLTVVPVYSADGGYQAVVATFAAINANTQQPDEAFFFLDYWMSEECQSSAAYGYMNWQQAVPTMEGLMTSEKPCTYMEGIDGRGKAVFRHWRMTDAVYEEFCRVRENISSVHFATPIDRELSFLMGDVLYGEGDLDVEKLTHEAYMRMKMIAAES